MKPKGQSGRSGKQGDAPGQGGGAAGNRGKNAYGQAGKGNFRSGGRNPEKPGIQAAGKKSGNDHSKGSFQDAGYGAKPDRTGDRRPIKRDADRMPDRRYGTEELSPPADRDENMVEGRNPVLALLKSGRSVDKLYIAKDAEGSIGRVTAAARERGVPISFCDKRKLDSLSTTRAHQGVIALAAAYDYRTMDEVFALAEASGRPPLIVLCDGVTDPHNLGAIIRSAEIMGAHGVVIPKNRSAGLNAACAKAAAGALEYLPVVRVSNLVACAGDLKDRGVWIFGTGASGETSLQEADFSVPAALVIGSEGEGMSRLMAETCDRILSIPMLGKTPSLNASTAAAVALYQAMLCRLAQKE